MICPSKLLTRSARSFVSWLPFGGPVQKTSLSSQAEEASFDLMPFKKYLLEEGPTETTSLTRDEGIKYFRDMVVVRRLETSASSLYKEKVVRGFCHLCSGQEAVCIGITSAMRPQDSIITSYRAHGITYAMGVSVLQILSELTGRKSGIVRGKGGSMHMYAENFYGGNGIVGAQVPLGTGVAFKHKYTGDGGVNFALYGDGAANQGQVFESYNIAKLWDLPIVFVCENNHYGMGTPEERSSAETNYYKRGQYIPGLWVDGMDILTVREATRFAIDYCSVQKKGPLVYEISTYRYHGHSMSDPGTSYRTRDEIQEVRTTRDPITGFREKLLSSGLATVEELKAIEVEVRKEVDAETKKAQADSEIGVEELYYDVYENNLQGKLKGLTPWDFHDHKKTQKAINANDEKATNVDAKNQEDFDTKDEEAANVGKENLDEKNQKVKEDESKEEAKEENKADQQEINTADTDEKADPELEKNQEKEKQEDVNPEKSKDV